MPAGLLIPSPKAAGNEAALGVARKYDYACEKPLKRELRVVIVEHRENNGRESSERGGLA